MAGSFARGINPDKIPKEVRPVRHKFNAVAVEDDGIKFSSKLERDYYRWLKEQCVIGTAVGFLRQVPFHLPGNSSHRIDFLVFWADGSVTGDDPKGQETEVFRLKAKQVAQLYPWMTFRKVKKVRGEWEYLLYVEAK